MNPPKKKTTGTVERSIYCCYYYYYYYCYYYYHRFHGAFTGGFSAGYFNSVGSKNNEVVMIISNYDENITIIIYNANLNYYN